MAAESTKGWQKMVVVYYLNVQHSLAGAIWSTLLEESDLVRLHGLVYKEEESSNCT